MHLPLLTLMRSSPPANATAPTPRRTRPHRSPPPPPPARMLLLFVCRLRRKQLLTAHSSVSSCMTSALLWTNWTACGDTRPSPKGIEEGCQSRAPDRDSLQMIGATVSDVVPGIEALAFSDRSELLEPDLVGVVLEELPATVLVREWANGDRLMAPILSRVARAVVECEPLCLTPVTSLLPDLAYSANLLNLAGAVDVDGSRDGDLPSHWRDLSITPLQAREVLGTPAALLLVAGAVREATCLALRLADMPRLSTAPPGFVGACASIADWAVGERGLERFGDALVAARAATDLPRDIERALTALDGVPLERLVTGSAWLYDPVAAMARVLDFDQRRFMLISRRIYAGQERQTLDQLARELNVTRERVRQIEGQVAEQIAERLEEPANGAVHRAAARLREEVGICRRMTELPRVAAVGIDALAPQSSEDQLYCRALMKMAGPWVPHKSWLLRGDHADLPQRTRDSLVSALASGPVPEREALAALAEHGIPEIDCSDWLRDVGRCHVLDGQVVDWSGSMADKAMEVLNVRGEPLSGAEIAAALGPDVNFRSMINQIQPDDRFMRRGLKRYGLRRWGGEEYTTIKDEIEQEIERRGGAASVEDLVETLCAQFGVSESSVRAYASDAPFERNSQGLIVIATGPAQYERHAIEDTRGCFRVGTDWAWRLVVDSEVLRGSGRPIPLAVVQTAGLEPGDRHVMATPVGDVLIRYGRQPTIGSLRRAALHVAAHEGDRLFVVLRGTAALEFQLVTAAEIERATGLERLALEVGAKGAEDLTRGVAQALGLPPDEYGVPAIRRRLRARREPELLDLLPDASPEAVDVGLLDELIGLGE